MTGLFGGVPCTGVLVRTAVNIEYGAESRASQLINAVYVVIITSVAIGGFSKMPLAAIAAMLIVSAVNLGKTAAQMCYGFY